MKYLISILLSLSLAVLSPLAAKETPSQDIPVGSGNADSVSTEDTTNDHAPGTCPIEENTAAILEMPAVGIYAPLLSPQPKASVMKTKQAKKKKKNTAPVTKTLEP